MLEVLDGWAHIQSGEVEGYVSMDYLLTGPDARVKANEIVHTVVVVNGDGLNVREAPNTESAVLTQVASGGGDGLSGDPGRLDQGGSGCG